MPWDLFEASFSLFAAIPIAGDAAGAGKLAYNVVRRIKNP